MAQSTAAAWQNLLGYTPPRRQTVVGGPVDPTGAPFFLPATSASLSITSQLLTSSAPLVVTAAQGAGSGGAADLVGLATANLTWSGLTASATNYLYVTVNAGGTLTPGSTTLPPIYQWGGTPSTVAGQFTYNISESKGYLGNGSSAPATPVVFLGEAVTSGSGVTSTVAYAYSGVFIGQLTAIPAISSQAVFTHNLGVPALGYVAGVRLVCVTTNLGYPVGAEIPWGQAGVSAGTLAGVNGKKASLATDNTVSITLAPYAGGNMTAITNASWQLKVLRREKLLMSAIWQGRV